MNFPQITHRVVKVTSLSALRDLKSKDVLYVGTYKECMKYAENEAEHGCLGIIGMEFMNYKFAESTDFLDN